MTHRRRIAVIGLGYVGLPVAAGFASVGFDVLGFDIDDRRISELCRGIDRTREVEAKALTQATLSFTNAVADLRRCDFFIITVPTPIDVARRPDMSAVLKASQTVGTVLKRGDIVVYESTVYPGATEEECIPVLEAASGLSAAADFGVGYSPERINPGDREHRFETIQKIVSAQDPSALEIIASVYGAAVRAGVYRAQSIRVAEAAKVIENAQRDLNIAFMNELSAIFSRLGIDTPEVLAAARTKWNFLPFTPGLVGGHCIGVDPYYLTYRAEKAGYHPEVILAGRRINDSVGQRIAYECLRFLLRSGTRNPRVVILGLTFKENVPDIRNTRVVDIIRTLESFGIESCVHDPHVEPEEALREYNVKLHTLDAIEPCDAVIVAVRHKEFVMAGWSLVEKLLKGQRGAVLDVRVALDARQTPPGVELWRL